MLTKMRLLLIGAMVMTAVQAAEQIVQPVLTTAPLHNYEDAPATPDADDPAIWVNQRDRGRSLVIGTAKDAGLLVYDLKGQMVQAILPPNAPQVLPEDPATPTGENPDADRPCPDSAEGETIGRYNNVDIAYDVALSNRPGGPRADVAVVSDRGCDRIRFFRIDPGDPDGPLVDITALDVPRVFPERYNQPSAVQPSGDLEGWRDNPVDDQNTVYGLTVAQGDTDDVFECEYEGEPTGLEDVVAPGSAANAGAFLEADLEGLSIVESRPGRTLMLASSQGDSSFHFYELTPSLTRHLSTFLVDGVGETDGVHVVTSPLGTRFPRGLLVVQNGDAPPPDDAGDVNGFELDGSTQFKLVDVRDMLAALSR